MKKLLELMNEYAHTYADHYDDTGEEITIIFLSHTDNCFQYVCDGSYETLVDDTVISKRFGFIKWLVKNDKIDGLKFYGENEYTPIGVNAKSDIDQIYSVEEQILMTLSISDTPIEDLISYLK